MHHTFFSSSMHKRKRSEDASSERVVKRPTTLAIRSPPPSRPTSLFCNVSAFSPFTGQLTPGDTSEDESVTQDDIWSADYRVPELSDSVESVSSIKVQISSPRSQRGYDTPGTVSDMTLTPSSPVRPRIGRARSNDLLSSPPRGLTPTRPMQSHDRIPTPITGHFNTHLDNLPSAPRHNFPPVHTNLSPMMEQEQWGSLNRRSSYGQTSLPSPAEDIHTSNLDNDTDMDAEMLDESTTTSMSTLRVSADDDVMETEEGSHAVNQRQRLNRQGHSRNRSSQAGRTARLHMGFLTGCEKCLQKVPGHYSHILWS